MRHDHEFITEGAMTHMVDRFEFESPLGILGWLVDRLVLSRYMRSFLIRRNETLKHLAESEEWRQFLVESGSPDFDSQSLSR